VAGGAAGTGNGGGSADGHGGGRAQEGLQLVASLADAGAGRMAGWLGRMARAVAGDVAERVSAHGEPGNRSGRAAVGADPTPALGPAPSEDGTGGSTQACNC
jgi:hypothetical protein